ncbi:Vitamin B12 import ATP-binding protein BtuD [Vibrio stylophorae]|uniref:Vitamin B12 import ATP-binding protein BtuD n=1 Tax=Vibrio stylophorae TaxID=659351 RepID=A0ABM8ZTF4_9VIBR|nr:vitamin B12 ABC transporter ATP-binding protein BtuD [Vibrio stylophorae]CAH0533452.1 Vitamin B12 import ATP-binding protein BtuD [Vibrio stylophorae]
MLKLENIAHTQRLLPLSLAIAAGESCHLLGPNGSGKSTLLMCISGLLSGEGRVYWQAQNLAKLSLASQAQYRSVLLQQQRPSFHLRVFQYLLVSLAPLQRTLSAEVEQVLMALAKRLGIDDKLSRQLDTLSGGEWQRVRLLACFLQVWPTLNPQARFLLLDEPMNALDLTHQRVVYQLIAELKSNGLAIVIASHDLSQSYRHADQVLVLQHGVKCAYGPPQTVLTPALIEQVFAIQAQILAQEPKRLLLDV